MKGLIEVKHPLLIHRLSQLRDMKTPRELMRSYLEDVGFLLTCEALKSSPLERKLSETWIGERELPFLREEDYVLVAVLRAGLPMLEGALRALRNADAGFLGISRDEKTLRSEVYYSRLPNLKGRKVFLLDPMLATGATLSVALAKIYGGEPSEVVCLTLLCAPQGVERVLSSFPEAVIYTVSLEEGLDPRGYIIPGLGDMGDRLFSAPSESL